MSFGPCETVNVKADVEGGYVRMNKADYDPKVHGELYDGEAAPSHVQEPHVTQATAEQDSAAASAAAVEAANGGWATPLADAPAAPPVEAVEAAAEAAPEAKAAKAK